MDLKTREKILHIMNMTLMLNDVNGDNVFCEFCGHTSAVEVRVYNRGWSVYQDPDYKCRTYIDIDSDVLDKLDNMIEYLEQLAKRNGINVSL